MKQDIPGIKMSTPYTVSLNLIQGLQIMPTNSVGTVLLYRVSTQKQDSQSNSTMLDCTLSAKSSDQEMTGLDGQMYEVNHTSIYSGIR